MAGETETLPKNKLEYLDRNILAYLYKNPKLNDIEFIVNGQIFPANKCIVCGASDVFEAMLLGSFQESSTGQIKISNVTYSESFSSLLGYIYGFGIQVDSLRLEVILEILKLGHCYRFPNLCEALKAYVSKLVFLTPSEYSYGTNLFMELLNTAYIYKIDDLYERMQNVIMSSPENVHRFLEHPKLLDVKCPVLIDIFAADNFHTEEVKILGVVLKWIDANTTLRETDSETEDADLKDEKEIRLPRVCDSNSSNVENSDPGIQLPSYYKCLLNDTLDKMKSTADNPKMDLNEQKVEVYESTDREPEENSAIDCKHTQNDESLSDVERLMKTVRPTRLSLPDVATFLQKNAQFCETYENFMAPIIYCKNCVHNQNSRIPFIGSSILVTFPVSCDRVYNVVSTDIRFQHFVINLSMFKSPSRLLKHDTIVHLNLKNYSYFQDLLLNYTLKLRPCNPFMKSFIIEHKKSIHINFSKKVVWNSSYPQKVALLSSYLCNEFVTSPELFVQDSSVTLEADFEILPTFVKF